MADNKNKKVPETFDFSGYATKNDVVCSDKRTIRKDAFKKNDGTIVPLVWQHVHSDPANILGHAYLENREDGVYAYGIFNDTEQGLNAKKLVEHGDITALSIYANQLLEKNLIVHEGAIREVSLVLAGANPGAKIDLLTFSHSDGSENVVEDEAIIYSGLGLDKKEVEHADATDAKTSSDDSETVADVFETLNEKQKTVVYAIIAQAIDGEAAATTDGEAAHSDDEGDKAVMKKNVFNQEDDADKGTTTLTHAQFSEIISDAQKMGSFKASVLAHLDEYGITNIGYLFPDARTLTPDPDMISRDMTWVQTFMSGTRHSPFSRVKSVAADITADDARAKGYVKASLKKEEVIALLKRETTPTTIYKKQKLDRDDIVDITDMDVVAWLKAEMRVMLDEEIARAALIGDGRDAEDADKISETNIRPIWTDADMYSHKEQLVVDTDVEGVIEGIIRARKNYKGSGNPTLFIGSDLLTSMLLLKDTTHRRLYATQAELQSALRVSNIVEVGLLDGLTRETGAGPTLKEWTLQGILVNLKDYVFGSDKGGALGMFDDFDIDYNQYKYLIESRLSGALTKPKSAVVIELDTTEGT